MSYTCKLKWKRLSDECAIAFSEYGVYRDFFGNIWWESKHDDEEKFSKVVMKSRVACLSHLESLENAAAIPPGRPVEEHGNMEVMKLLLRLVERINGDVCEIKEMLK